MGNSSFHATLSPSARHRWGACPGSVREEAKYPEPPDSPHALDGTRTHAILEQCLKNGTKIDSGFIGATANDEHGSYTWDADRLARVNVALDWIWSQPNGHNAIAEQRVYPDGFVGRADMSGTVDVQIPGDPYIIVDYKDGMVQVSAEDNPQLKQYAIGVLAGLDQSNLPKSVMMVIIQPKLALRGMPVISVYNMPIGALLADAERLKTEGAATDDPNAPLVPGEAQCKWCKAKATCPALAGKVMQELNLMSSLFGPVNPEPHGLVGPADLATQAANKDPEKMGDKELRQILEAAPLVESFLAAVEKEAKRRLEAGIAVPGFKLVRGNGSRGWALPEEEIVKKLVGMGAPKSAVYKQALVSVAQAEKLTWDSKGETKGFSDRQAKSMLAEYVTTSAGKPTIAPESDPRPAIVTDASALFGTIGVHATVAEPPIPSFFGSAPPAPSWLS